MSHHSVGPIYCETPLTEAVSFPIEYLNTLSSVVPALFGLLALIWLWRRGSRQYVLYLIAVLTLATGVGSTLWHGLREPITLAFDAFPGLAAFLLVATVWPYYLGGRLAALLTVVALFGLQFVFMALDLFPEGNGPPISVFVATTIIASGLLVWTYKKAGRLALWGAAMIAAALAAAVFRSVDLAVCDFLPFGTHFLWHILLGAAAYFAVLFLARLSQPSR